MVVDAFSVLRDSLSVSADWLRLSSRWHQKARQIEGGRRRLILMAWAMPPSTNAGVYRPLSFVRYAPADRWAVHAVHAVGPSAPTLAGLELDSQWPEGVPRTRISLSERKPSWRLFPQVDGGFVSAIDMAKDAICNLQDVQPDVVLASGPPFCMFIAGAMVANHFRAKLVLDYRDEWSQCPFDFVSHGRDDQRWEQACLKRADAVVFTTESHRHHQLATFPELHASKAHLVPNGWDSATATTDFSPHDTSAGDTALLTISHIGNLASHTPIQGILSLVERLVEHDASWRTKLRLVFIGARSAEAQEQLDVFPYPDMLEVINHVPKSEADQRMRATDILLLIAVRDLERYLPGKLFEYVAARRPILVVGHPGEASSVVQELGVGALVSADSKAPEFEQALRSLCRLGNAMPNEVSGWLAEHRRPQVAAGLFRMLDKLVDGQDRKPVDHEFVST